MARKYQLKQRALRQEETRQRIVEAAVALHTTVGPANTSVSAIAERAGVQRHTFYRYFADERALSVACSGLYMEQHPPPDADAWRDIADPAARLRHGLGELYAFYERNGEALEPIMRDALTHAPTREINEHRLGPVFAAMHAVLSAPFRFEDASRQRAFGAALALVFDFFVWKQLRASCGSPDAAVEVAARAVCAQRLPDDACRESTSR